MKLSKNERKEFHGALLDAFPSYKNLEMMVGFELEESLEKIAGSGELYYIIFKLIQWAETYGILEKLIRGAHEENPGNPKLKAFYQKKLSSPITSENRRTPTVTSPESNIPGNTSTHQTQLKTFKFQTPTVNRRGEIINRKTKTVQYFTENLPDNITLDMVYIPGGTFMMGTEDEEVERLIQKYGSELEQYFRWEQPQHEVTVPAFFMGKYPVTQAQWKAVANLPQVEKKLEIDPSHFKGDILPVEQVSWRDAVEFCKRLSNHTGREYRLPSEAEWEYACRAGTKTPFHFGETITHKLANYYASYTFADESQGEYREKTTPVGAFPHNAFCLYDMHGNVWEWCKD